MYIIDTHRFKLVFAEREGFKPPVPCGTAVFKTAAIDHSAISPMVIFHPFIQRRCKGRAFSEFCKCFEDKIAFIKTKLYFYGHKFYYNNIDL